MMRTWLQSFNRAASAEAELRPTANRKDHRARQVQARLFWLLGGMSLCLGALLARAIVVQFVDREFYQAEGDLRYQREVSVPAYRGAIKDRNGEPLAISSPVMSIWANPKELLTEPAAIAKLAEALQQNGEQLRTRITQLSDREFVYLKRQMSPEAAEAITALDLPGVYAQREFRRFYPAGDVAAHVLGFTNIDDQGQAGIESAFNYWLDGKPGRKRILQDRKGNRIKELATLQPAIAGKDLVLSIDRRVQYLAYRELKAAIAELGATSGSVVLLDVPTSEVLAMVNYPSYNPNVRNSGDNDALRNRAVTDVFEPGSVMKAFTVAAGLESGKFSPHTAIDTSPGRIRLANYTIGDMHNYGLTDVTGVIMHSSNVGAVKIAMQLSNTELHDMLRRFGFGRDTRSGFPAESPGYLPPAARWGESEKGTISYGYGLSVTPLQLAVGYTTIANQGRMRAPTFVKNANLPDEAIMDPAIAAQMMDMLETVTGPGGTGGFARVANYRIAGKTGTARKASRSGYDMRYVGSFAGIAPASRPRIACVVVINDPKSQRYTGGAVAAPVYSRVTAGALRLLNVTPDAPQSEGVVTQITAEMLHSTDEAVGEPVLRQ